MSAKATSAAAARQICRHHIIVQGKVQGVFYRKHAQKAAQELGVTGWVRNLPDGTVELTAEGTAAQLRALETWCHTGSPKSSVTAVVVTDLLAPSGEPEAEKNPAPATREFVAFDVKR